MERRSFVKNIALGTGSLLAGPFVSAASPFADESFGKKKPLHKLKKPLAMVMWDFSWILRHHRYGEFENWKKVLEELADRGYDALRLDIMPQYIAADTDGKITEEFRSVKNGCAPAKWGNDYTMSFRPREALLEFLPLCKKYGFRVALSTWFTNHNTGPRGIFSEEGGVLRAWTETLTFLQQHGLLDDNIIYIDLLNEYPKYHGFDWIRKELGLRGNIEEYKLNNPSAFVPDDLNMGKGSGYNPLQQKFLDDFAKDLVRKLKAKFPQYPYTMSVTYTTPLETVDVSEYGTLDYHLWFTAAADIPHWRALGGIDQSKDNRPAFQELLRFWEEKKPEMTQWMDNAITRVATKARLHNITAGNTEGWGPVGWLDHPELNWNWVKEAADIAVELAKKHDNYKYICSSNFTHPQFKGIWEDIKWHRRITSRIKR
ncbi:MAG TPA: cellulase-like family protein [Flavisolibacter sp.]|nr:cellulase-like family protein [Flavisolibacter sp.]